MRRSSSFLSSVSVRAKRTVAWMVVLLFGCITAQAQPSITGLSPTSGTVGTTVTISGANFGASQGLTSTVTFGGIVAAGRGRPAVSWSTSSIRVLVPGGATTGNVVVTVGGAASNGVNFAVLPVIQSVSPTTGVVGTSVTVSGTGFGNTLAQGPSTVSFNGVSASPATWSSTGFTVPVPQGATAGNIVVTVGGQVSNGVPFTPTPVIGGLSTTSGVIGTPVTITGSSFGNAQGTSTLSFNGVIATNISNWSNASITATVPTNATTGNVVVSVNGVPSNGVIFTLVPSLTAISTNPVLANQLVILTGRGFGTSASTGTVTFNGIAGTPTSWSDTSITVPVPGNATAGLVVVAINGVASNGIPFAFVAPYAFSITYAPNGDVLTANDPVNGNWTYTYDDFNRLATANNTNPAQQFNYVYDQYGNRWQQNLTGGTGGQALFTFNSNPTAIANGNCYRAAGLTNQVDGNCYDAAGNLLSDGQHNFVYDAENRIVSVDNGSAVYVYNGDGQRIRKTTGAGDSDFLYGLKGRVVTELTSGAWSRSEVYAGTRHLATYSNGTTYFEQSDWLESGRVRTLPNGAPFEVCSNLPFGDGLTCKGSTDPGPDHFTDKERDVESQLDYFGARYYGSSAGRFVTTDPGPFTIADPQSWNRYSYVQNNPLKFVDAKGRKLTLTGDNAEDLVAELEFKTGYKLNYDEDTGDVTIDTKVKRKTKGTSKELAKELKKVIDDQHTVSLDVGENMADTFFDNFINQRFDMVDYKAFNNHYPSLAAALLGHVLEEYLTAASSGQGFTNQTYPAAHNAGLDEESKVMSDYTHKVEQPRQEAWANQTTVQFIYTSVEFDVVYKNNQNGPSVGPITKKSLPAQPAPAGH